MKRIKECKIGNLKIKNNVFLAPIAGYTDLPFRLICKHFGAGLVYSEMVSAKGLYFNSSNTNILLDTNELESPLAVQIFGRDVNILADIAKKLEQSGVLLIDINMGCPAPKIVKNGEGSALLKEPLLVSKIIEKVSYSVKIPVTVKIRKGFNLNCVNAVDIAKIAQECGAAAITVHGRTREEYFRGSVDLEIIKSVKESVNIPVIGNGDIYCVNDANNMFDYTNCDAIMIGRGSLGNPWIFKQLTKNYDYNEIETLTQEEILSIMIKHAKLHIKTKGIHKGILEIRKHLIHYVKGMKNASELRAKINMVKSISDIENLISVTNTNSSLKT